MIYSVLLVQRGITSNSHPVNGKSGKLYGTATQSPPHGGVAFSMGLSDYLDHAHDLCGNTAAGQQWVPEFVASGTNQHVHRCDRCQKPATAIWQQYYFCDEHAPSNATFIDGREQPKKEPVAAAPPPTQVEPISKPVEDKHQEIELPPEHMGAPKIGTEHEGKAETIAHVAPKPEGQPPGSPEVHHGQPQAATVTEMLKTSPAAETSDQPPPAAGKQTAVDVIANAVVNRVTAQLPEIVENILDAKGITARQPNKKKVKKSQPRPESDFTRLQKRAKELGINSFGKNSEQLKAEIAAKAETST